MVNRILYITSFNKQIYKWSAIRLISSFIKLDIKGDLLICYEDDDYLDNIKSYILKYVKNINIYFYQLSQDPFLIKWLDDNKNLIPKEYGGCYDKNTAPKEIVERMEGTIKIKQRCNLHQGGYCKKASYGLEK